MHDVRLLLAVRCAAWSKLRASYVYTDRLDLMYKSCSWRALALGLLTEFIQADDFRMTHPAVTAFSFRVDADRWLSHGLLSLTGKGLKGACATCCVHVTLSTTYIIYIRASWVVKSQRKRYRALFLPRQLSTFLFCRAVSALASQSCLCGTGSGKSTP